MFFCLKFALWFAALVGGLGLLETGCAADGAGDFEVGEDFALGEVGGGAGLGADLVGVGDDLLHEVAALQISLLHLAEFELPVAGEFRRVEAFDLHFADEGNQSHAAAGDEEFAAFAGEVFLGNKAFDRRRAGGGGAESALGHGFAEGLVVDEFPGTFHGGEQGGFGHPGGWFGFLGEHDDRIGVGGFNCSYGDEFVFPGGDARAAAVDFEPAGFHKDAAFGFETILLDAGEAGGLLELGGGVENGDEAFDDHVVELLLGLGELGEFTGGNDGKVIRDFLGVEHAA